MAFLFVYESVCREMQLVSGVFADLIVRNVFVYRCCKSDARDVSFLCVATLCVSHSALRRFPFLRPGVVEAVCRNCPDVLCPHGFVCFY